MGSSDGNHGLKCCDVLAQTKSLGSELLVFHSIGFLANIKPIATFVITSFDALGLHCSDR